MRSRFILDLPPMLKAQAMIVARQHGMSLSAFIRYLLTIQVAKAGMTEAEVVNVR